MPTSKVKNTKDVIGKAKDGFGFGDYINNIKDINKVKDISKEPDTTTIHYFGGRDHTELRTEKSLNGKVVKTEIIR